MTRYFSFVPVSAGIQDAAVIKNIRFVLPIATIASGLHSTVLKCGLQTCSGKVLAQWGRCDYFSINFVFVAYRYSTVHCILQLYTCITWITATVFEYIV